MQALIEPQRDGTVAIHLDSEALRAMVASVIFASRFHKGIRPFARLLKAGLKYAGAVAERRTSCR